MSVIRRKIELEGKENWENARNLDELCDAMIFSLRQNVETPWYGITETETESILETLIEIAQTHEMFTIEGQPGICDDEERQRAYMKAIIATDILDKLIENLPDDIAIFIYDYFSGEIEIVNGDTEEKDWHKRNEDTINLTSVYERGIETKFHTTFIINRFKEEALDVMDFMLNDETVRKLMGKSDNYNNDDLVSFVKLIYHPKCKLKLAETVLEALYKSISFI
uniref:DUF6919 domain-containing protein n=1 Tax=Pithovirus LCPAC401 TaxID=2506595 RepID=A0A481ZCF5_9VIRU|nr:MAG: hypothetical protein LCPAC401_03870 [Pithovirus LCPAC401]